MMFVSVFILLLLTVIVTDYFRWRHAQTTPARRRLLAAVLILCNLPLLIMILGSLFASDNTTAMMYIGMWLFWSWLLLALPRLLFYLFRRLHLPRVGIAVALLTAAALIWGVTVGRTRIQVNRVEICSQKLPASFDGFRIVQLSDMHIGTIVDPERELQRIVDSVQALRPDLIIFTGDLVNIRSEELDDRIARLLSGLQAPYGVASVIGNHDTGVYIRDTVNHPEAQSLRAVIDWQRRLGWNVLEDTTCYLVRGSDSISLSGISFDPELREKRHDHHLPPARLHQVYAGVPDSLFNITAVHLPQIWEQILETPYGDLTLSGHVHSMQIKLRLFGSDLSPARFLYPRWSGRYDEADRTLYINDGTGYVLYPMRLGAWPEVTLLTLRRCE